MIRAVALLLAGLVSSARAGMGEDDANDIKGRGFGKPTNVVVEPVELPPLPSNGGGCVEVYSLGNCHTSWLGQYHEQAATLNDKPIWLATSSGSVRVLSLLQVSPICCRTPPIVNGREPAEAAASVYG